MSTADRESSTPPADGSAHLPIEDLSAAALDAKTTEQVKGGLGQLRNQAALNSSASSSGSAETSK